MNIKDKIEKVFQNEQKTAIQYCSRLAQNMGIQIYLVGGVVRDLILNKKSYDIDILVEDSAIIFCELLAKNHPNEIEILAQNDKFQTAKVRFIFHNQPIEIDFASTRSEIYEYPSALPSLVETGVSLKKDMERRDFTINAIAASLNKTNFGEVIDYFGGTEDINNGIIRILHNNSFVDDPTRILRALKFRVRFDFNLEEKTKALQKQCLDAKQFDNLCSERIKKELKSGLNLLKSEYFDKLISENIYRLIISDISKINIPTGKIICEIINSNLNHINKENIWVIFLSILFYFAPTEPVIENIEKLALTSAEQRILMDFFKLKSNNKKFNEAKTPYDIYTLLKNFTPESIIANQCLQTNIDNSDKIFLYLNELKDAKLKINGHYIKEYPEIEKIHYKDILEEVMKARLNKKISDTEEKSYLKKICKRYLKTEKGAV
ncbi:MAG: hypothetical protein PHX18_07070 [Candidatus Gastranaerophilales bacterium]|nr:hypothetical protein [Candidatus Gastranaerophilales bacterium]